MTITASTPPDPQEDDQAAALRRSLIAIRDLRQRVAELEARGSEPIAIVGMACRFPGGATAPERFWELLRDGVDATGDVPPERWDSEALYDPDPEAPGRVYVRRGAFLREPVDGFDPGFFDISPREAAEMDPIHRMLLELSWEALERAGIPAHGLTGRDVGVFVGVSGSDYFIMQTKRRTDEIQAYGGTGSAASIAGGRLAHFLGVHGPAIAVDTACSSGLVALVMAVENLRRGRCSVALAGSSHLMLTPEGTIFLCRMRALSADGRCRTYSADASGYGRGEGGAMLVLKRLKDAQADGDPIFAVIRGAACNHDGRSSGLTVPNPDAQRAVIAAAIEDAKLRPEQIGYVETHGTATPLGDPIELRALSAVLGAGRPPADPLLVGSVKTNFGHLEAVAGLAGVMKTVLALRHGAIPPHLHFDTPTPQVDWGALPLRVPTQLTPWDGGGKARRAGVSAFGFSGTNAHVVLEEAPPRPTDERPRRPVEILPLSGRSPAAVRELAGRYRARLAAEGDAGLPSLAASATAGRSHLTHRVAAVGADAAALDDALAVIEELPNEAILGGMSAPGPIAFLFTGQGSQAPGMARELWQSAPVFRQALERCAAIVDPHLDEPLLPLLVEDGGPERIRRTALAQPALFGLEFALAELWRSWGVEPDYVLGHSLGEYVAATVSGVLTLEEALPLIATRGRLMQALPAGGRMVAVHAAVPAVAAALNGVEGVAIAAENGPDSTVISGEGAAVAEVLEQLTGQGIRHQALEVSHAFHSPLMEPILGEFEAAVARTTLRPPRTPLVSNLTGTLLTDAEATDPARWRRHIREPVRFSASIGALVERGVASFLEVGPHPTLCALGRMTAPDPELRWLPSLRRGAPAWPELLESLRALYTAGYDLDWEGFAREYAGRRDAAPTYPFQRQRHWLTDGPAGAAPGTGTAGRDTGHPLLGVALESPALDGTIFEAAVSPGHPPLLAQHRVQGHVVMPGAGYIEMIVSAARHAYGWDRVRIRGLELIHPLVLPPEGATTCQTILERATDDGVAVRIVSRPSAEKPWHTHLTATVAALDAPVHGADDLATLRARIIEPTDVGSIYRDLEARGLEYGPTFRCLHEVWRGEREVLGHAELPASARDRTRFALHPGMLDAGLQILAGFPSPIDEEAATFLPAACDEILVHGDLPAAGWVHGHLQAGGSSEATDEVVADIALLDSDGVAAVRLMGFRARRLRHSVALADEHAELALDWQDRGDAPVPLELAGTWLLLEDEGGVAAALRASLEAGGARVIGLRSGLAYGQPAPDRFVLDPTSPDDWKRLLVDAGLDPVTGRARALIHCWAIGGPPAGTHSAPDQRTGSAPDVGASDEPDVSQVVEKAVFPLAALLQAGIAAVLDDGIRIVTAGAAGPAAGATDGWLEGAGLWGLASVVEAEHPELRCRLLDVGPVDGPVDGGRLLAALLDPGDEDRLALDGGRTRAARLVPRLALGGQDRREVPSGEAYRIALDRRGTLDSLRYQAVSRRPPDAGEVEVAVSLTGLNFRDVLNVLGQYPGEAGLPGVEFAGTVARVGSGVTELRAGDAVIGIGVGAFASHVTLAAQAVVPAPLGLTAAEAATVPVTFLTAEYGLVHLARLQAGERVLIHAAAGGVGQAATQIARALGADVFATAGSDEKRALLRAQGVTHVFDSRSPSFADELLRATGGEGVHVALNSLTGPMLRRSLEVVVRPGGRFLEIGKAELLEEAELAQGFPGLEYIPYDVGSLLLDTPTEYQRVFRGLVDRFEVGALTPLRTRIFAPEEIVTACRYMAQARHIGKVVVRAARPARSRIRPDATYLVTGGLGGVGREVTRWLVDRGAKSVILAGRTEPDPEARAWMEGLERGGATVRWQRCDVGRPEDVRGAVDEAAAPGRPLRGVFHLAGTTSDALLEGQTRERFHQVLAPKVGGAWHLHRATAELDLDHFVLFSSFAGTLGGPGQAAYAAANAVLDALADHRAAVGLPALALGWGAWGGDGMIARLGEGEQDLLRQRGLGLLDPERALATLDRLLDEGAVRALVADVDWSRAVAGGRVPPLLREIHGDAAPAAAPAHPGAGVLLSSELGSMTPGERKRALEEYMQATLATVLRIPPTELGPESDVRNLGFDSLMAVEVRNQIETELGILMPPRVFLDGPTPAGMAAELARAAGPDASPEALDVDAASTDRSGREAFYFGPPDSALFGSLHRPAGKEQNSHGVVLSYPFGQEYIRSHRSFVQLAERLARKGFPTLRFDYHGCGDSQGSLDEASIARWISDVHSAIDEISRRGRSVAHSLVGMRLGATVAALAAARRDDVDRLVLWNPVVDGGDHRRELTRMHRDMLRHSYVAQGEDSSLDDGIVELMGYPVPETLLSEIEAFNLLEMTDRPAERILLLDSVDGHGIDHLQGHLEGLGARVRVERFPGPALWLEEPFAEVVPVDIWRRVVHWLSETSR